MKNILCVVGTRPEAIKMAPVVRQLQQHKNHFNVTLCVSGQHKELLHDILPLFDLKPDITLDVMTNNQSLAALTARLLEALDAVVRKNHYDWIMAQGDTTTVYVAALTSYYHRITFAHVEAGLRTNDISNPFPEEMNRFATDHMSQLLFAPTPGAARQLMYENIDQEKIVITGNTAIDAFLFTKEHRGQDDSPLLHSLITSGKKLITITAHRREIHGKPFLGLLDTFKTLAQELGPKGFHFVYPVHPNPNISVPARDTLKDQTHLSLLPPLPYHEMVWLICQSHLILTDSGGLQEEAPAANIPVVVLREHTERPEGIEAGCSVLAGTSGPKIIDTCNSLLNDKSLYQKMCDAKNPYGDGKAAQKIVEALISYE